MPAATSNCEKADLVLGLRQRAEWAYEELILQWSDKLYHVALQIVRNPEEAKEIIQEVFLKVVEKIDTFEGNASLYTWLYRITVNEALMRLRTHKKEVQIAWEDFLPKYESGIHLENFPEWTKPPDEMFMEKEFHEFIQAAIDLLPADIKTAYLLKDVERLSEEAVCEILALSKPAMKNRVHRARLFLRKKIEEHYVRKT